MRDLMKPTVVLFLICVIVAGALGLTYSATAAKIEERAAMDAEAARKEVFKNADSFEKIDSKNEIITEVYKAIKDNKVSGYAFSASSKGYGGAIQITIGIDTEKKVTGVKIGEHKETPGLGAKASDRSFLDQFSGFVSKEPLKVIKTKKSKPEEIEAISGATISSKAVTKAVQAAIDMIDELAKKEGNSK